MCFPISTTLHEWLREKRIMEGVAKRMGIPHSTLVAKLQGGTYRSKLGADEMVPLMQAIRDMGYGTELNGILGRFVQELTGEERHPAHSEDFGELLFGVIQGIGILSKSAARTDSLSAQRELAKLKTMIRAEIIPAVYKLEDIIDTRLERVRKKALKKATHRVPAVAKS